MRDNSLFPRGECFRERALPGGPLLDSNNGLMTIIKNDGNVEPSSLPQQFNIVLHIGLGR
jgi:hypothetical protein